MNKLQIALRIIVECGFFPEIFVSSIVFVVPHLFIFHADCLLYGIGIMRRKPLVVFFFVCFRIGDIDLSEILHERLTKLDNVTTEVKDLAVAAVQMLKVCTPRDGISQLQNNVHWI